MMLYDRYPFMKLLVAAGWYVGASRDNDHDKDGYDSNAAYLEFDDGIVHSWTPLEFMSPATIIIGSEPINRAGCPLWCRDHDTTLLFNIALCGILSTPAGHGVITRLVQLCDWSHISSSGDGGRKTWYTAIDIM